MPNKYIYADDFGQANHHSGTYPRIVEVGGVNYTLIKYESGWGENGTWGATFSLQGCSPSRVAIKAGTMSPDLLLSIPDPVYRVVTYPAFAANFTSNSVQVREAWFTSNGSKITDENLNLIHDPEESINLGSNVHDISHILVYYTCTTPASGSITVNKSVVAPLTDGVFTFSISKVGDDVWTYGGTPVVLTFPGGTGNNVFSLLDLNATYLITEESSSGTNVAFTTTSDPANGEILIGGDNPNTGSITFTNTGTTTPTPGSFAFSKTFEGLGEGILPAPGAEFTLYVTGTVAGTEPPVSIAGNPVTLTTNGTVSFAGIPAGIYDIVETIVPEGYVQMASITISVDTAGTVTVLVPGSLIGTDVINTTVEGITDVKGGRTATIEVLGTQELPFTGYDSLFKIIGGSFILLGLGLALYALNSKKAFQFLKK